MKPTRKTTTGPIEVKINPALPDIKPGASIQKKLDKANEMLRTVGIPKQAKA